LNTLLIPSDHIHNEEHPPHHPHYHIRYSLTEGESVTLKCSYDSSSQYVYLFWYRQYPNRALQYLLLRGARSQERFKASVDKTAVSLEISSTAVSDSALYYCALRPTVTETHQTLY
uniref:Ig-like domain-containing protein n=1 Tax=Astyanax mexicanus TaxID=7994 RepID=A0A3B1KAY1_ASTMX